MDTRVGVETLSEQLDDDDDSDISETPNLTDLISVPNSAPVFVGTYSHVFKGTYRGQYVAVKVLRPLSVSMKAMRRKVDREREVWGHLRHPNVVPLYGYTDESPIFGPFGALITPWFENGDAAKFLLTHGTSLTLEDRKRLWQGVVEGVRYLHEHVPTIVHGDLKPGNVLIDNDGNARLCDFGLAYIFLEDGHTGLTTTSQHMGTERYLAPELVLYDENEKPKTTSDVYALGCIGLEFTLLQLPFEHQQNNRQGLIIEDIMNGMAPASRPSNCNTQMSHLWDILEGCWDSTPELRLSAAEISAELASIQTLQEIAVNYEPDDSDDMAGLISVSESSDDGHRVDTISKVSASSKDEESQSESFSDVSGSVYSFTASAGFRSEQLAAAHAVLQTVNSDSVTRLSSPISIKGLLEIGIDRGWCLIGSCGRERVRQRDRRISYHGKDISMSFGILYVHVCEHLIYGQPLLMRCQDCSHGACREHDLRLQKEFDIPTLLRQPNYQKPPR